MHCVVRLTQFHIQQIEAYWRGSEGGSEGGGGGGGGGFYSTSIEITSFTPGCKNQDGGKPKIY